MNKKRGFTADEKRAVIQQCEVLNAELQTLLKLISGRAYARHVDKLVSLLNYIPYLADAVQHDYRLIEDTQESTAGST